MGPIQLVQAPSRGALLEFANALAPEHLLLAMTLEESERSVLRHFGTLFVGENSAPAFGDYCSGPNHTLPTGGQARSRGGLSVLDFLRSQTEHEFYDDGVLELAHTAIELARAEGLHQHQVSLELRMRDLGGGRKQQ
jgi:histidinol dehydrogenase/sulfopropanediol 3-dehydrogenase